MKRILILISLILASILPSEVFASEITVCDSSCNYTNLQAAIDAAVENDTIMIKSDISILDTINVTKNISIVGALEEETYALINYPYDKTAIKFNTAKVDIKNISFYYTDLDQASKNDVSTILIENSNSVSLYNLGIITLNNGLEIKNEIGTDPFIKLEDCMLIKYDDVLESNNGIILNSLSNVVAHNIFVGGFKNGLYLINTNMNLDSNIDQAVELYFGDFSYLDLNETSILINDSSLYLRYVSLSGITEEGENPSDVDASYNYWGSTEVDTSKLKVKNITYDNNYGSLSELLHFISSWEGKYYFDVDELTPVDTDKFEPIIDERESEQSSTTPPLVEETPDIENPKTAGELTFIVGIVFTIFSARLFINVYKKQKEI